MEGDAGASRLNPKDTDASSSEAKAEDSAESEDAADQETTEVADEDSAESEVGTDQTGTAEPGTDESSTSTSMTAQGFFDITEAKAEDSTESEDAADQEATEAKAEDSTESEDAAEPAEDGRIPSRLGRGWFIGIAAALAVLAGGAGAGGYLALRSHQDTRTTARHDTAAVEAAKTCVAVTQAPDTTAMAVSAEKMIDCGTGAYRSQAILYSSLLVEAYQAANAHVKVTDLLAAVERNNPDGSIEVLVPLRVKLSNSEAPNQEVGYRLRVTMVSDEGQYRIAKIDQVAT